MNRLAGELLVRGKLDRSQHRSVEEARREWRLQASKVVSEYSHGHGAEGTKNVGRCRLVYGGVSGGEYGRESRASIAVCR